MAQRTRLETQQGRQATGRQDATQPRRVRIAREQLERQAKQASSTQDTGSNSTEDALGVTIEATGRAPGPTPDASKKATAPAETMTGAVQRMRLVADLERVASGQAREDEALRLLDEGRRMLPNSPSAIARAGAALLARSDLSVVYAAAGMKEKVVKDFRPPRFKVQPPVRGGRYRATEEHADIVGHFVACGFPRHAIASVLRISEDTLEKHYKYELTNGKQIHVALLFHRLYAIAVFGHGKEAVTALIFLLKSVGGFKEAPDQIDVNVSGAIQHEHYALSHEERANRVLQILAGGGPKADRLLGLARQRTLEAKPGDADGGV